MNVNDFSKGVDLTATDGPTGSQVNQQFELGTPSSDRGLLLWTQDPVVGDPTGTVPNPLLSSDYTKTKRYVWLRIPNSAAADKTPYIYAWNDDAASDAVLLKWQWLQNQGATFETAVANAVAAYLAANPVTTPSIDDHSVTLPKLPTGTTALLGYPGLATTDAQAFQPSDLAESLVLLYNPAFGILFQKLNDAEFFDANSVDGTVLLNASVTNAKLIDGTVASAKLAASGVTAGVYGSSTLIPIVTVNAQGQVTAVATSAVSGLPTYATPATAAIPAAGATATIAHGLNAAPQFIRGTLACSSTDLGWAAGDELDLDSLSDNLNQPAFMMFVANADTTNVKFLRSDQTNIYARTKTTGAYGAIDTTKWTLKLYAEK